MVGEKLAQRVPKVRGENGEEDPLKRCPKFCPLGQNCARPAIGPAIPATWPGQPKSSKSKGNRAGHKQPAGWAGHGRDGPAMMAGQRPERPRPRGRPDRAAPSLFFRSFFLFFFCLENVRHRKCNIFHIRTPFSIILDSLKSSQRALQDYAGKHHSPTIYYNNQ